MRNCRRKKGMHLKNYDAFGGRQYNGVWTRFFLKAQNDLRNSVKPEGRRYTDSMSIKQL